MASHLCAKGLWYKEVPEVLQSIGILLQSIKQEEGVLCGLIDIDKGASPNMAKQRCGECHLSGVKGLVTVIRPPSGIPCMQIKKGESITNSCDGSLEV